MTGSFPVVEGPFDGDPAAVTVSGVLLAAGTSSRFGDANKLLATVAGEPLVRRAVAPLLAAPLDEVVVVVGHESEAVRAALGDLPVRAVENPEYDDGQATSVQRGVEAVRPPDVSETTDATGVVDSAADAARVADPDAVLFALGDMPDVSPDTVEALVAAFAASVGDPLAAACEGGRGNPVLFGRQFFDQLTDLAGDTGGREILREAADATLVETGDPGVRRDVDRPADL